MSEIQLYNTLLEGESRAQKSGAKCACIHAGRLLRLRRTSAITARRLQDILRRFLKLRGFQAEPRYAT